jgi:hypothetical protein
MENSKQKPPRTGICLKLNKKSTQPQKPKTYNQTELATSKYQ